MKTMDTGNFHLQFSDLSEDEINAESSRSKRFTKAISEVTNFMCIVQQ